MLGGIITIILYIILGKCVLSGMKFGCLGAFFLLYAGSLGLFGYLTYENGWDDLKYVYTSENTLDYLESKYHLSQIGISLTQYNDDAFSITVGENGDIEGSSFSTRKISCVFYLSKNIDDLGARTRMRWNKRASFRAIKQMLSMDAIILILYLTVFLVISILLLYFNKGCEQVNISKWRNWTLFLAFLLMAICIYIIPLLLNSPKYFARYDCDLIINNTNIKCFLANAYTADQTSMSKLRIDDERNIDIFYGSDDFFEFRYTRFNLGRFEYLIHLPYISEQSYKYLSAWGYKKLSDNWFYRIDSCLTDMVHLCIITFISLIIALLSVYII